VNAIAIRPHAIAELKFPWRIFGLFVFLAAAAGLLSGTACG